MAKGNDGNYFQHAIEVEAAVQLSAGDVSGGIHIGLAHGMAPFEQTEVGPNPAARAHLLHALNDSYRQPTAGESSLVTAYRKANASLNRYPNTAELLRQAVGADRLTGTITEVERDKYASLQQAWSGCRVVPVHSSWRSVIGAGEPLACPPMLAAPWLVTLDPMTYREEGEADDGNLYRADFARLIALFGPYLESNRPGMAAIFVYAIKPDVRPEFWRFAKELAEALHVLPSCCWMTHRGGSRNLAVLIHKGDLPGRLPRGVVAGDD